MHQFVRVVLVVVISLFSYQAVYSQSAEEIKGDWLGTLNLGGSSLRLVFHISEDEKGQLTSTLDSPDQGANGIRTSKTSFIDGQLDIEVAMIGGAYSGMLEDGVLKGTWAQGGGSLPLEMERMVHPIEYNRPQEPKKPYPYKEEVVRFTNETGGFELEGTLTVPASQGTFPVAILISGSGPQDRDESLMGHKPFWVLSDYLTRQGIAVLRYDDRGVGNSGGDFSTATTLDFVTDVEAAIQFLRTRSDIDSQSIGLIGHSEGGLIAPIVAQEEANSVSFVVMLAGPARRGKEILLSQSTQMAHLQGMPPFMVEKMKAVNDRLYDVVLDIEDIELLKIKLRNELREIRKELTPMEITGLGLIEERDDQIVGQLGNPWMQQFMGLDPQRYLKQVKSPVLSLIGEKDRQVIAIENSGLIERVLEASGNTDYTVKTLPGLNHLFQQADTGLPNEYATIEETFSEQAMEMITNWIKERI